MTHDVSVRGAGEGTSPGLTDHRRPVVVPGPCRHRPARLLYQTREHIDHDSAGTWAGSARLLGIFLATLCDRRCPGHR
jgi:hypothetical protein